MASRVLPTVRLIWPCDKAEQEVGGAWVIRNPWPAVELPPGATFPFRVNSCSVYVHLAEGLGAVDCAVEFLQVRDDGSRRPIGIGGVRRLEFTVENQLIPLRAKFDFKNVPFRSEGIYEFRVVAETDDGWQMLDGETAQIRALERRSRV